MSSNTVRQNPIRRLARSQSPLTIAVEILFALLIVVAFWYSQNSGFFIQRNNPDPVQETVVNDALPAPSPSLSFSQLVAFDPAGAGCRQLIANGSFERTGDWRLPLSPRPAAYTDEQFSDGSRSLRLGIGPTDQLVYSESQAAQTVDLPTDAHSLVLQADIWRTASGDGRDRQYLHVQAGSDQLTLFDGRFDLSSWQSVAYDVTLLAGRRAELVFGVVNSGGPGRAGMGVDNVRLYACQQPAATPASTASAKGRSSSLLMLPLVYRMAPTPIAPPLLSPTPSPTPTTISSVPPACTELVVNGGFESVGGWTMPNTPRPGRFVTEPVWSGRRSLGLGIPLGQVNAYSDSTAYQWITLPTDAAQITLSASLWRASSGGGDFHYLWVAAEGKTTRIVQGLANTQRWNVVTYDLTALAGSRLFLLLGTYNDGQGAVASLFADDVSIRACSSAVLPAPVTGTPASKQTPTVSQTPTAMRTPTPSRTPTRTATHTATATAIFTPSPTATSIYAPVAQMRSPDFGANAFLWWRQEIAHRDLGLMEKAGFRWVRQSFAWEDIQPRADEYLFTRADRVVGQVNASGLSLLVRLGMDPDTTDFWAGQPPAANAKFVEFVSTLARRYNCTADAVGCVQAWQVWNEPNLAREWGGTRPNPAQYTALLGQVYRAIKAANPNAIVISAGMAPTGTDNAIAMPDTRYYQEMYRAMGGQSDGYFDLLGIHASGFAAPPEIDPTQAAANPAYGGQRFFAFRHVEDIRKIMQANGDGDKRIAILEFGWTSDPVNPDYVWFGAGAGIDEFVKADYLRRAYRYAGEHWQPWIGLMSALTMPNLDWLNDGDPFDEEQYWWAILEPSQIDELRLRPAFVELCIYFRGLKGEKCLYDPN